MDAELRGELAALRARAYGPDSDLADDPAGVARLQELEDLERRARAQTAPPEVPESAPDVDRLPADLEREVEEDEPEERPSRRPVVRRARTLWLWAGSLAAVAAVASAASIAATTIVPVARTAGIAQVGALQADPAADTEAVGAFGLDDGATAGFLDFYGLTAFTGSAQTDSFGNRADCLLLVETADLEDSADESLFRGAYRYGACGAGVFPATIQFVVTAELPEEFRRRFPVGSSVQFVRDGERVGVFSDAE